MCSGLREVDRIQDSFQCKDCLWPFHELCLKKWRRQPENHGTNLLLCPNCADNSLDRDFGNTIPREIVSKYTFRCANGCEAINVYSDARQHTSFCPKNKVICPLNCGDLLEKSIDAMTNHLLVDCIRMEI